MDQAQTAGALRTERERLTSYLSSLPEAAWDKPSLCEGWSVRDVVSHLVGNAADIVAQRLDGAGSVEFNQRQIDERSDTSPAQLLEEWAEQGPLFEQNVRDLPDDFWNTPYPPFGTVGTALGRIVEDIWVHAHDIRLPLGDDVADGPGLQETLEVIARELPERAGRLAPNVGAVELVADGFERAVDIGDGERLRVEGDSVALAFVGTGRMSLDEAIAEGKLRLSPTVPAGIADALNIYGP